MDQLQNAKYLLAVVFFVALIFFKLMYLSITYFPEWLVLLFTSIFAVIIYYPFHQYKLKQFSGCQMKIFYLSTKKMIINISCCGTHFLKITLLSSGDHNM